MALILLTNVIISSAQFADVKSAPRPISESESISEYTDISAHAPISAFGKNPDACIHALDSTQKYSFPKNIILSYT
jgi:hypothetical protein